jgi:pyrimidine deaminase RibD-like protein
MSDPNATLHASLLNLALAQSYSCTPAQGAFSVGCVIFLPRSVAQQHETSSPDGGKLDALFDLLEPSFPTFRSGGVAEDGPEREEGYAEQVQGLILSTSYSRALEGNTHAEANALTLLERKISDFPEELQREVLAATGREGGELGKEGVYQAILAYAWMYATMEPCSRRTSGLRSCTDAILASSLKRVYIVRRLLAL